ncbi:MAG: hypothetical protein JOZ78_19270 [Chroococcidiopsidaceae cyanobacterium CP_BM_ER_R8_30]|nr:hypothetical protein [Chroococcidiopsidaceae cyanobacterium CP_BM_ER_R8_30]
MSLRTLTLPALLVVISLAAPVKAQHPPASSPPTREQIADACIHNHADTLPIPFSDISPKDWAFKAVMTMYYCGAFRSYAPPTLFQQATPTSSRG